MSDRLTSAHQPTVRGLSARASVQFAELVGGELALAKGELLATARKAGTSLTMLVTAAVLGFTAWFAFVAAAIIGIAEALPAWGAALIIGGSLAVVAGRITALAGRRLSAVSSPLALTADSVQRDMREIRERMHR